MRNNFLEEFYHGNISPQSQTISSDKHFKAAWDKFVATEEILSHRLDGEDKKLFEEYVDSYGLVLSMNDAESFIRGFKFGARIIFDTFFEPDSKKSGGSYTSKTGAVKKIDEYSLEVVMTDNSRIKIDRISNIESELFDSFEY